MGRPNKRRQVLVVDIISPLIGIRLETLFVVAPGGQGGPNPTLTLPQTNPNPDPHNPADHEVPVRGLPLGRFEGLTSFDECVSKEYPKNAMQSLQKDPTRPAWQ